MARSRKTSRRRPASKVAAVVCLVAVLLFIVALYALFLKPNHAALPDGTAVTYTVKSGASSAGIAAGMKKAGLIDSTTIFQFRLLKSGARRYLKAGTHRFVAGSNYDRLILELQQSPGAPAVKVVIPEGKNIKQIAAILEDKLGLSAAEFTAYAEHAAPDFVDQYPFLAGVYGDSLEGYLFPDTYQFSKDSSIKQVCSDMLGRFSQVWSTLSVPDSAPYSATQLVTIASLVEKEVSVPAERPLVSSVIYNRLDRNMRLQLCSTVQFLLPDPDKNKLRLTADDLATPSPYNTYLHAGLPPGPIANPGKAALQAAIAPAKTDYLYFVLTGKDGSQTFAATNEEFARAKALSKQVFGQ